MEEAALDLVGSLHTQLHQLATFQRLIAPPDARFSSSADLVLRHGLPFQGTIPRFRLWPKQCFQCCYERATRRNSRWVYCEGFAISPGIGLAMAHAWIVSREHPTEAVDLAWGDTESAVYLGIPIRADWLHQMFHISGKRSYGVLDAWWAHHPLLTGLKPIEDVIEQL